MATATEIRTLTQAHRNTQVNTSTKLAALAMAYYATKVNPSMPAQVEQWLALFLPRILAGSETSARLAAAYATNLRLMEMPAERRIEVETRPGSIEQQIRTSLITVGPQSYANKLTQIRDLDVAPQQRAALMREAKVSSSKRVAAATMRHVQSGGRETLIGHARDDRTVLGWVRVTRGEPCFFCAMLASRGLVFADDSFEFSNAQFEGAGEFKVHDECRCTLKPVRDRKTDPLLADVKKFEDMWTRWGAGGTRPSGADVDTGAALRFRRGYDHWLKTGAFLDWDVVANSESFRAR